MEERENLARELETRRKELRDTWTSLAKQAGMSSQNLLRIRNGEIELTRDAAAGIERAFQWEPGGVNRALSGEKPSPRQGDGQVRNYRPARTYIPARLDAARDHLASMPDDDLWEMATAVAVASGPSAAIDFVVKAYALRVNETSTVAADET